MEDETTTVLLEDPLEPIEDAPAFQPTSVHDIESTAFLDALEQGKPLEQFFASNWTLLYHEDNRCDGSTDGEIHNLSKSAIDSELVIRVANDGDGWVCEAQEPSEFDLHFELSKKVRSWDRYEIEPSAGDTEDKIYVMGAGESDYLVLHYNTNKLIVKLEYRSEDPG